jgi:deoxyribonuclease V
MLHSWDISPKEAVALQQRLAGLVRVEPIAGPVRTVAGADCAFAAGPWGPTWGGGEIIAAAVLCDAETMAVLCRSETHRPCTFPYVPGLLSFREAPAIIEVVGKLSPRPDLLMCDGQGLAHPRGMGLACHVGLWVDMPVIGVAKSRLCGEHGDVPAHRGGRAELMLDGRVVGAVLRTRDNVRPLFISVGNRVTLDEAVAWTLRAGGGFRLPQPTRLADMMVSQLRKN